MEHYRLEVGVQNQRRCCWHGRSNVGTWRETYSHSIRLSTELDSVVFNGQLHYYYSKSQTELWCPRSTLFFRSGRLRCITVTSSSFWCRFPVNSASYKSSSNCISFSPDGKHMAVAHRKSCKDSIGIYACAPHGNWEQLQHFQVPLELHPETESQYCKFTFWQLTCQISHHF